MLATSEPPSVARDCVNEAGDPEWRDRPTSGSWGEWLMHFAARLPPGTRDDCRAPRKRAPARSAFPSGDLYFDVPHFVNGLVLTLLFFMRLYPCLNGS